LVLLTGAFYIFPPPPQELRLAHQPSETSPILAGGALAPDRLRFHRNGDEVFRAEAVAPSLDQRKGTSALLARAFKWLGHPEDELGWEIDRSLRDLDTLARLVHSGHRKEAIQLCLKLRKSGDASVLALETILEHLGIKQNFVHPPDPVVAASQLRRDGNPPGPSTVCSVEGPEKSGGCYFVP